MRERGMMSFEAAISFFMLLLAASALPLFSLPTSQADDFFLCSDVAYSLMKTRAFFTSPVNLAERLARIGNMTGLCIEAGVRSEGIFASSCPADSKSFHTVSFSFPVSGHDGGVSKATVSCRRDNGVPPAVQ